MHRRRTVLRCLAALVFVSAASALPSAKPQDERQTFGARFIEPADGFVVKERKGQLLVDAETGVIRFERDHRVLLSVDADNLVA
jgi:hypothetical protein